MLIIYFLINFLILLPINSVNTECICIPDYRSDVYRGSTAHAPSLLSDTVDHIFDTMFGTWDNLCSTIRDLLRRLKENSEEPLELLQKLLNKEYTRIFENLQPNLRRITQKFRQFALISNDADDYGNDFDGVNHRRNNKPHWTQILIRPKYFHFAKPSRPMAPYRTFSFPRLRAMFEPNQQIKTPKNRRTKHPEGLKEIHDKIQNFIDKMQQKRNDFDAIADDLKRYIDELLEKRNNACIDKDSLLPKTDDNSDSINKIARFIERNGIKLKNRQELIDFLRGIIQKSNDYDLIQAAKDVLKSLYRHLYRTSLGKSPNNRDPTGKSPKNSLNNYLNSGDFTKLISTLNGNNPKNDKILPTIYLILILSNDRNPANAESGWDDLRKELGKSLPQFRTHEALELSRAIFNKILNASRDKQAENRLASPESDNDETMLNQIKQVANDSNINEFMDFMTFKYDLGELFDSIERKHPNIRQNKDYLNVKLILQTMQVFDYLKRFNLPTHQDNDKRFMSIIALLLDKNAPFKDVDAFLKLKEYFTKDKGVANRFAPSASDVDIIGVFLGNNNYPKNISRTDDLMNFMLYNSALHDLFEIIEAKHPNIINEDYLNVKTILQTKQVFDYLKRFNLTTYQDNDERFLYIISLMSDKASPIGYVDIFDKLKEYFNGTKLKNKILNATRSGPVNRLAPSQSDEDLIGAFLNFIGHPTSTSRADDLMNFIFYNSAIEDLFDVVETKHPNIVNEDYSNVKSTLQTKQVYDYLKTLNLTIYRDNDKRFVYLISLILEKNSPIENVDSFAKLKKYFNGLEVKTSGSNKIPNVIRAKKVLDRFVPITIDSEVQTMLNRMKMAVNDSNINAHVDFMVYKYDLGELFDSIETKHPDIINEDYLSVKSILQTKPVYNYLKRFNLTTYQDNDKRFLYIITLMLDKNSPIQYVDAFFKLKTYFNVGEGVSITKQLKLNLTKHFDEVFFEQLDGMTPEQSNDYDTVLKFITTHKTQIELGDFDYDPNDSSTETIQKFFKHLLTLDNSIVPNHVKIAVDDLIKLLH